MHKAADTDMTKAMDTWGHKWAHNTVRSSSTICRRPAGNRATFNAGKTQGFATAGALEHPKVVETKFAGANELGSKEAYSAVLKSRSMQLASVNNRIETNTRTTAEATTRAALGIARLGDLLEGKKGSGEQGRLNTAGNVMSLLSVTEIMEEGARDGPLDDRRRPHVHAQIPVHHQRPVRWAQYRPRRVRQQLRRPL